MKLNNKHRVLSVVLLMLVMMLSFASVVAFADNGNSTNVAKIGETEYGSLAEAIKAAKDGETVTLLADITSVGKPVTVPADVTATLDLNGHTLKVSKYTTEKDQVLVEGSLTLTDSVGTGKVCSDYTGTAGRVVSVSGSGSLQLDGGTITTEGMEKSGTAVYVAANCKFTMSGGTVYADAKRNNNAVKLTNAKASMEMRGGTITAIPTADSDDDVYAISAAYSPVKITAGTVSGHLAMSVGNGSAITGGTFTDVDVISLAGYVDETAYACEKQADGSYTVAKAEFTAVATITDKDGVVTRYAAATEAFSALKDGDTLVMLDDIGTAAEPLPYGIVVTDGDVKVNLNAKTLIIGYDAAAAAAAGVPSYAAGVGIVNGGSGTVKVSGNGKLDVSNYTGTDGIAVWARTGSITVQSGTFINKSNEEATVYVGTNDDSSPVLKIAGGKYMNIAEGNYKYDESRTPLTFNIYNGKTADALKISAGSFYGNNDPYLGDDQVKGSILATEMTGVRKNDGYYVVAGGQGIQLLDANGGAKNFYSGASTSSTGKITVALADAADGDTLILLKDIFTSNQLNVTKAVTIDLGGHTLTNSYGDSGYSLLTRAAVTMKNGTYKSTKASARGIGAVAGFTLENATVESTGLVGLGCSAPDATYTVKNSTVIGNYALANFVNNAKINIESSTITGTGTGIYHNGSNSGLQLTAVDSTITAAATGATNGIYVSGSTDTMAAAGAQQVTLTNCTVSGGTAIEVKYTDLTLDGCNVSSTATGEPSYSQNNNGSAASGFAVVSTDNAMNNTTPKPEGTIIIKGEGKYTGPVGLGSLKSVKNTYKDFKDETIKVSAGTFSSRVPSSYCAEGFVPVKNSDGSYSVKEGSFVAEVNGEKYTTLQEAIAAAARNSTVKLIADTCENVTISTPYVTLDLNGFTLNGGREKGKPALTVTARVTVKDSSEAQTGTIMREDTAENSGVSSHYVIDIQGSGWLTFESGKVTNNSGNTAGKGASLVRVGDDSVAKYPGLNIKGGTFTQDNFIVIKVDRGDLFLNGGTLNSAKSYAIENWLRATIKGGTVNGAVSSWTYSGGSNSTLTISGGTVNGNVESVSYDGSAGKKASVSITGGTVNGTLSTKLYNDTTTPGKDVATIEVTGGTFTDDPTKYVIEDSAITANADGTFGVAKAYLAKVGETSYYTMDEAFKAQTASGEAIVLLRDYTTGSTFNSGTINRTVDLSGFTWTCTGTDANSAAFEINNPNVTLTVKNGKVVSSQLVGLIPSAMGGTITYDNSGLVFESVEMSTTATSGIETNGNNTNDSVMLKNSTLNVPNGFGIYFPSSGKLTLDNSTVTAKTMGVQVCAGSLSINEGSAVMVTGDAVPKTENDGAIQDGAAISIVNRTGYKGLGTVTIEGGTFSSLKAYKWENKTESVFDNTSNTIQISGGTFSSAVPEAYCAEGYVPVKNSDGTYSVAKESDGVIKVTIESQPITIGSVGETYYKEGDQITLSTGVVPDGYVFDGWYRKNGDGSLDKLSVYNVKLEDAAYTFVAVFREKVKFSLAIETGGYVNFNDVDVDTSFVGKERASGTSINLIAKVNDGSEFLYWKNARGIIVSTEPVYNFTIAENVSLTACFKTIDKSKECYVVFKDKSNKIIKSDSVTLENGVGYITAPYATTSYAGYRFIGWKLDGSDDETRYSAGQQLPVNSDATFSAVYVSTVSELTITVDGTKLSEAYSYGDFVSVTAGKKDGETFVGWKDINGNFVSYSETYRFTITANVVLTTVYETNGSVPEKTASISLIFNDRQSDESTQSILMVASWIVPDEYKYISAGLLLTNDDGSKDSLKLGNEETNTAIKKYTANHPEGTNESSYIFTLTLKTSPAKGASVYGVAYLIFVDDAGQTHTIYTELQISKPVK